MDKKEKRVVFAISSSIAGGAQIYLYNIIEYVRNDYSILVICPNGFFYDKVKRLEKVDVIKHNISFTSVLSLHKLLKKEVESYKEIYINAHLLGTGLWLREAIKGIPNTHLTVTLHNNVIYDKISIAKRILHPIFLKYISKGASGFIAVSREISDSVIKYTGKNCEYIPSSVPVKGLPKNVDSFNLNKEKIFVGFVGRISLPKNPVRFVETAAIISKKIPNVIFLVVGDGELRNEMENAVKKEKMESYFSFLGFLPNPAEEMKKLDVLLLTSDHEGTPMVLLEAMSYGLPVVSTRVGGIPTVIDSWVDGVLSDGFEPETIANDVISLLSDKEKYISISHKAYDKIKYVFSYDANITKCLNVVLNA